MPFDLLLGRKTFEIWAPYWPQHADAWPGVNTATKYVVSNTMTSGEWQPSRVLNGIRKVRRCGGIGIKGRIPVTGGKPAPTAHRRELTGKREHIYHVAGSTRTPPPSWTWSGSGRWWMT